MRRMCREQVGKCCGGNIGEGEGEGEGEEGVCLEVLGRPFVRTGDFRGGFYCWENSQSLSGGCRTVQYLYRGKRSGIADRTPGVKPRGNSIEFNGNASRR